MSVKKINPPLNFSANAHVKNMDQYKKEYNESIADRNAFWAEKAERISWVKKWDSVGEFDYVNTGDSGGELTAANDVWI